MIERQQNIPPWGGWYSRHRYWASFAAGLLVFAIILVSCLKSAKPSPEASITTEAVAVDETPPAFTEIEDITERKKAFFSYLRPIVRGENDAILRKRERLLVLHEKRLGGSRLSGTEVNWLKQLSSEYGVELALSEDITWTRLMRRVDIVPEGLALVQAAVESRWGTSRFAVEGNSFFGEWCFSKDCGTVPERREDGKYHEVEAFTTARASVRSYLKNLNTHYAYHDFRARRHALRLKEKPLDVEMLVPGLLRYSERREEYVQQIRDMMQQNRVLLEG